ncbi:response regulator [Paenibacillus fonticola]|uniref:response regulator n=1 Tax=Paenibacillus fonticola TaxID=379896 RepID=UPI00036BF3EA|nr:response regulator [Paenibacillus fonticola]
MNIRVLLADDEPVILRGLKKLISWEELGLMIVGEANDGNELRQLIQTCDPDLIISDISMPGCSGIDIIREVHEKNLQVKVVFISAYQEFAYAKQAIQYGALEYLVKPVIKSHLEEVVTRAAALIREETEGERAKEMLDHYERKNRTVTIEELLDSLTDGNRKAAAELIHLGAIAISRYTTVCLLETDTDTNTDADAVMSGASHWEERERKLVHFALNNIIKETIEAAGNALMFHKEGQFGILVQHETLGEPAQLAEDLHGKINNYLKLKVSIGVGNAVSGAEEAEHSYRTALKALRRKYFVGLNRVIANEGADFETTESSSHTLNELQASLVKALTSQQREQIPEMTQQLLSLIKQQAGGSKNVAVSNIYNTILVLEQEMSHIGVSIDRIHQEPSSLLDRLSGYCTYEGVEREVEAIAQQIYEQIAHKLTNKEAVQLGEIKAYIEEHYAENITLDSMAALIYMNPYYFSSFFKKHTGQNFKQYLTEVRMKHAVRLLLETDMMIYEISDRVGYNNARHFSDMFKKMYGKLPQEYKQSAKVE